MSEPNKHEPLDYFGPGFVMAVIISFLADACALSLIGILIPGIGLAFLALFIGIHYLAGFALAFLIFPSLKHLVPKLILGIAILIPAPGLSFGLFLAVIAQNRFIEFLINEAAIEGGKRLLQAGEFLVPVAGEAAMVATEVVADTAQATEVGVGGVEAVGAGVEAASAATESAGAVAETGGEAIQKGGDYAKKGFEHLKDNIDQRDDERGDEEEDEALGEMPSPSKEAMRENFPGAENMEAEKEGGAPRKDAVAYGNFARPSNAPKEEEESAPSDAEAPSNVVQSEERFQKRNPRTQRAEQSSNDGNPRTPGKVILRDNGGIVDLANPPEMPKEQAS